MDSRLRGKNGDGRGGAAKMDSGSGAGMTRVGVDSYLHGNDGREGILRYTRNDMWGVG